MFLRRKKRNFFFPSSIVLVKSSIFEFILYLDNDIDYVINQIKNLPSLLFLSLICHDKGVYISDIYDDDGVLLHSEGEKIDLHFHLLVKFKNERKLDKLSELTGIKAQNIECKNNFQASWYYLLHRKVDGTPRIDKSDIYDVVDFIYNDYTPSSSLGELVEAQYIFDYINECPHYISDKDMMSFVLKNNLYGTYRRAYSLYKNLIKEHNSQSF